MTSPALVAADRGTAGAAATRLCVPAGLYLGDGCISAHARGVYRLRLFLDARYPGIVERRGGARYGACSLRTASIASRARAGSRTAPHVPTSSSPCTRRPCRVSFLSTAPGASTSARSRSRNGSAGSLRRYPEPLLRGLIHSDGCRFINTGRNWRHPRYSFSNASPRHPHDLLRRLRSRRRPLDDGAAHGLRFAQSMMWPAWTSFIRAEGLTARVPAHASQVAAKLADDSAMCRYRLGD